MPAFEDVDALSTAAQPKLSHEAHPAVKSLGLEGKPWGALSPFLSIFL